MKTKTPAKPDAEIIITKGEGAAQREISRIPFVVNFYNEQEFKAAQKNIFAVVNALKKAYETDQNEYVHVQIIFNFLYVNA